jgi:uncharacterized DUF497 family protein
MPFEYGSAKSAANQRKHGIDFERAQALWDDPRAIGARRARATSRASSWSA